MIGANADRDHGSADKLDEGESHGHWVNPFRNSVAGPAGGKPGAKGGAAAAQFWKQPRRWLHVDANGKTSYVTVRCGAHAVLRTTKGPQHVSKKTALAACVLCIVLVCAESASFRQPGVCHPGREASPGARAQRLLPRPAHLGPPGAAGKPTSYAAHPVSAHHAGTAIHAQTPQGRACILTHCRGVHRIALAQRCRMSCNL